MKKTIAALIVIALIIAVVVVLSQPATNELGDKYIVDPVTGDEYDPQEWQGVQELEEDEVTSEPPDFDRKSTSEECEKSDGFFRDSCYSNLALIKSDFSYCNSIAKENFDIVDTCFYQLALQEKNAQLCLKMNYGIADCLTEIALLSLDSKYCDMAAFERSSCLKAVAQNDYEQCRKLGEGRGFCNEAVLNKSASHCDKIFDTGQYCFEQLALKTNNANYCSKVSNPNPCYYGIAVNTNNHSLCNLLKEGSELCIALIAFNTNNPSLCELAGTERENCLKDLAQ